MSSVCKHGNYCGGSEGCNRCLNEALRYSKLLSPAQLKPSIPSCSFCGKTQAEVKKLIAGPTVYICDECVELCNDIIGNDDAIKSTKKPKKRKS